MRNLRPSRKLLSIAILGATAALAQSGSAEFGVAVVKPNLTGERNSGFRRFTGGQLDARNITLKMLIAFAYDLPQDRVLRGPSWLDSERYNILAKPDPVPNADTSMTTLRARTQSLLAARFQLAFHKETKQLPVFRLFVEKDGPKNFHPAKGDNSDIVNNGHHVTGLATSMEFFAKNFLTGQLGAPVIDQTGIPGKFDLSLDWTPDEAPPARPGDDNDRTAPAEPSGPSIFVALRQQLGLRLEAGKGPVEVLIVDRAEKPSEN